MQIIEQCNTSHSLNVQNCHPVKDVLMRDTPMSFVSFMSLLKCLLSNKPGCSISCLSSVKRPIYHPLYTLYKIHDSANMEKLLLV